MKIAIDVSQVVYEGTGVANYTSNLIEEIVKNKDHEFFLFGYSWGRRKILKDFFKKYSPLPQVTTKLIPWPNSLVNRWGNVWHRINLEDLIGRFDLLHTSDWVEFPSKKIKVTTIHDLVVFKYPQHLPETIVVTQKQKLNWIARESRLIFADSEATKFDIIKYLKIDEQKIKVVYLGVDESFYKRSDAEITSVKRKYDLPEKYILFVGKREPRKNLERLVSAFQLDKLNDISLVIVGGKGWGEELKAGNNIKLLDMVDREDLAVLYSGADCFVYPSLYEGFGLPILEAMRCEVPVVTSDRGSLAEIAHQSIMVDPESVESIAQGLKAVINLTSDKKSEILKQNLEWAKKFTWQKTAAEVIKNYESLF